MLCCMTANILGACTQYGFKERFKETHKYIYVARKTANQIET